MKAQGLYPPLGMQQESRYTLLHDVPLTLSLDSIWDFNLDVRRMARADP